MKDATYAPGPNLPTINGLQATAAWVDEMNAEPLHVIEPEQRKSRAPSAPLPENPTLQDRLRRYSPTNGYARYTSMAADRIDELTATVASQQMLLSRIKAILAERNYKVHALTVENEHHKVNEQNLQKLIVDLNNECDALADKLVEVGSEQEAAQERGLFATIAHYYRSKK